MANFKIKITGSGTIDEILLSLENLKSCVEVGLGGEDSTLFMEIEEDE